MSGGKKKSLHTPKLPIASEEILYDYVNNVRIQQPQMLICDTVLQVKAQLLPSPCSL